MLGTGGNEGIYLKEKQREVMWFDALESMYQFVKWLFLFAELLWQIDAVESV